MNIERMTRGRTGRLGLALAAVVIMGAWTAPSALASAAHKKKLSMSTVTIVAGTTAGALPLWVALDQGFFAKQGVTVNWLNSSTGSASTTTILIAGAAQFTIDSAPSQVLAAQQGAPLRGLVQANLDAIQEVVISQAFASAHNIPLTANSEAQAVAQLQALKGTHIPIAESTSAATSYSWLVTLANDHGVTSGLNCSSCDINLSTVGSVPNEEAAINSGKVAGFGGVPPNTTAAVTIPSIEIPLWRINPATRAAGQYLATTTSMINQNPDTVQAVTTGFLEGMNYMTTHTKQAQRDVDRVWATPAVGYTSPEEQDYLFADFLPFLKNPFPSKSGYNQGLALINGAQPAPITLPYSGFVVPRFINTAAKVLGIKLT